MPEETDESTPRAPSAVEHPDDRRRRPKEHLSRRLLEALEESPDLVAEEAPVHAGAALEDAVRERASDIHLDPSSGGVQVRLRVDGVLHDTILLTDDQGRHLTNQLKTLGRIDPVQAFAPQEGRFRTSIEDREIDLRIEVAPALRGEKATVRVLDRGMVERTIADLGLSGEDVERVRSWLAQLAGMGLVVGPTGSGKTTTLYALLHELKGLERSVITLEDPAEYQIDGITQIEVDPGHALTFAEGIKSMLRLDPDFLLVGELRDRASARGAANAATSGKPLMSTLHSRDAAAAVRGLRNLGLDNHEIASVLTLVIAQRLVRTLCHECRREEPPTDAEREWLDLVGADVPDTTWHAAGCEACRDIGYLGRTGVFEIWRLDDEDQTLVLHDADLREIRSNLADRGHRFLLDDALAKAERGVTSLDELRAVGGLGAGTRRPSAPDGA